MKVLIAGGGTGGHLMPALAIGAELGARRKDVEIVYVGATRGLEATVLPARGVRHYLLPAEPIYRRQWWKNVRQPIVAWRVLRECHRILHEEAPVLAIGTGGYAAGPVLLAARWRGVPTVLQEQNAFPGLTTRWLAGGARQVHLGFPEAARRITPGPATEVFTLGNPIVPPTSALTRAAARAKLGIAPDARVILCMGGSQGALAPNRAVQGIIDGGLLPGVVILWSTGQGHWERYRQYDAPPARLVRAFWDPIADAYAAADLVVARSGAMTLAELCAFGLPSILIPLPTAAADHQTVNAQALEASSASVLLPESRLSAESLSEIIRSLLGDATRLANMRASALKRAAPDATKDIVTRIISLLPVT